MKNRNLDHKDHTKDKANIKILYEHGLKRCGCCGRIKPLKEFSRRHKYEQKGYLIPYQSYCKECFNKNQRKRYAEKKSVA